MTEKIAQKCNEKVGFCYQIVINLQNKSGYLKISKKGLNFITKSCKIDVYYLKETVRKCGEGNAACFLFKKVH